MFTFPPNISSRALPPPGRCSSLFEWAVTVLGPPDTLYEGGFFNAVLKFPKDYPQSPPEMRFTSEMWWVLGWWVLCTDVGAVL